MKYNSLEIRSNIVKTDLYRAIVEKVFEDRGVIQSKSIVYADDDLLSDEMDKVKWFIDE